MKNIKLNRWFLAGIAFGCLSLFLIKLPGSNWFAFTAALLALILMAFSFKKFDDMK